MKKLFALFLALMMIVCLAACGEANQPSDDGNTPSENVTAYSDSLEILSAIWDAMPEDSRFPCYGGNQTENSKMDAPDEFQLTDVDGLNYVLIIPESVHGYLDNAASLNHLMNANIFTGAVVHVTDAEAGDVGTEIKDSILNYHFICGFPEKLVMLTLDNYILYAFGNEGLVNNFRDTATSALTGEVEVLCDQWIE